MQTACKKNETQNICIEERTQTEAWYRSRCAGDKHLWMNEKAHAGPVLSCPVLIMGPARHAERVLSLQQGTGSLSTRLAGGLVMLLGCNSRSSLGG